VRTRGSRVPRSPRLLIGIVGLGVAIVLAGCGGGSGDQAPAHKVVPGAPVIKVVAKSFSFDPSTITISAGKDVTIELVSQDAFHDFVVDKGIGEVVGAGGGQTRQGGLKIDKPGRYTIYCSIPGHRAAGMEGRLVVE
jgi:plastocyanin